MNDWLMNAVDAESVRQHHLVELACERALLTGTHGVRVVRDGPWLISAEPSPDVPYGHIHEYRLDLRGVPVSETGS